MDSLTRQSILITGSSGFLGWHAAAWFSQSRLTVGTYRSQEQVPPGVEAQALDVTDARATEELLERLRPACVVHAAALAQPAACEKDPQLAEWVNVEGTRNVARAAQKMGARLIYISTDLVFDGRRGDYSETDSPAPLSVYGETKLRAEAQVAEEHHDYLIARTALMYGPGPPGHGSFSDWLQGRLQAGETAPLYSDEYRTPLYVGDAVQALKMLADSSYQREVFHVAGPQRINRYTFGETLAEVFGYERSLLQPVRREELPSSAPRARDCSLNTSKLQRALGFRGRSVRDSLAAMRDEFTAGQSASTAPGSGA